MIGIFSGDVKGDRAAKCAIEESCGQHKNTFKRTIAETMFDVTPDEIAQLNDTDLRELVGRLCEAELARLGLSPVAVTWGGNQTAADGGLDVRVALPSQTIIDGFIPRAATGFQVKAQDMARSEIVAEMRPKGVIRPFIKELSDQAGSYVIVSSRGSTADIALRNRQNALREALTGVANADQLHVDFYDRTRMATWVRRHPGVITWVKEKLGRGLVGWRPYGPWSGSAEEVDAEYLLDDKLRLHLRNSHDAPAKPVGEAIDDLRDELTRAGNAVRLVGLSGVGKTRLVQALFDVRIGLRPLPPSLAIYTNLSDSPDPQPIGLASDLIANRTRAILIVDNCPPDLHRRLAEQCAASESTVSILTVEYDVQDDVPEGTQVVTLTTSSPDLIEKLLARRYPHLSQVDTRSIAEVSGGNARIAIALAGTVERSDTIANLSDNELFQRLFRQRQDADDALYRAVQALSLVYSFQGEELTGSEAELPRLALLANQAPQDIYRHAGELLRRDLVQRRGVWRAVLPHAIANRLAARALEDIHFDIIDQQLVTGGTERLARSFSRRLSFLHEHPRATAIVDRWLAPGGFLGDANNFNDLGRAMFENVARVSPAAALACLERAGDGDPGIAALTWRLHLSLLRSLAYDPQLFERCASLLAQAATQGTEVVHVANRASETFASLFTIYLSGTHATIKQRLQVIERLLRSDEPKQRSLGLAGLQNVLKTRYFSGAGDFQFGSHSRDYGYRPNSSEDVIEWFGAALALIERLALEEFVLKPELMTLLAQNFRELCTSTPMFDKLASLFRRIAAERFWREGWIACRQTLRLHRETLTPEAASQLAALEADLMPRNLAERVRGVVLGDWTSPHYIEDTEFDDDIKSGFARLNALACELGAAVATDETVFGELIPDLLRGGVRVQSFGRALADAAEDRRAAWTKLVDGLAEIPEKERDVRVLCGFIGSLWERDRDLAQEVLDAALEQSALVPFLPLLEAAVQIDSRGANRMKRALRSGSAPVEMYGALAWTDQISDDDLKDLILMILEQAGGFDVALVILSMRLDLDRSAQRAHEPKLIDAGRELLRHVKFTKDNERDDYCLAGIARACLTGPDAARIASELAKRFQRAVAAYESYAWHNYELLKALITVQTTSVLDALFLGDEGARRLITHFDELRPNPASEVSCEDLIAWCDRDPETRYPLAASIVSFSGHIEEDGPRVWSEQARALIENAPDRRSVLSVFIGRFRPMSWSGSRASLMEAYSRLLDDFAEEPADFATFIAEAKSELARDIAKERRLETDHDQDRDGRFE
jgi:hypothetical protein